MKKFGRTIIPLLLSCAFIFSGCSSNKNNTASENIDFTGNFPVENYVPDRNDVRAVPYTYVGEGINFNIVCNVRKLTEDERIFKIAMKKEAREQLEQTKEQYHQYSDEYEELIDKTDFETEMLEQADELYVTEILGEYKGRGKITDDSIASYSIVCDDEKILSSASPANAEQWISIINTADGSYTEGIFLPDRESLEMTITYGATTESVTLYKQ